MADFSIDALNVFGEIIPHPELPGHLDVPSPSRGILLRTTKPVWTIGRGDGSLNSVAIKVMSTQLNTSRLHARIEWHADENLAYIYDTNSTYGTWMGNIRLSSETGTRLDEKSIVIWCGVPHNEGSSCFIYVNKARDNLLTQHWIVESVVGRGRYGQVMKCYKRSEQTEVRAIKVIRYTGYTYEPLPTRSDVLKTVAIMSAVQNGPNICAIVDTFDNPDLNMFFVVMAYYPLGNLRTALGDRPVAEAMVKTITFQVTVALVYLHSQDIVLVDVDPTKILVETLHPPTFKVGNFGMAQCLPPLRVLQGTYGRGNLAFTAPEVYLFGRYGEPADLFSTGLLTFNLLLGLSESSFFEGPICLDTDEEVRAWFTKRKLQWRRLQDSASVACKRFLSRLLENDPARRMTAKEATHHPWLAGQAHEGNQTRPLTSQPTVGILSTSPPFPTTTQSRSDAASRNTSGTQNKAAPTRWSARLLSKH